MINPFHYGEVVAGADFADRESELKSLVSDLSGPSRIFEGLDSPKNRLKKKFQLKVSDGGV